jgi:hypothetical protein
MSDYGEENYDYDYGDEEYGEESSNVVNVFRDRERVGTREALGTSIEGQGKLAKMMERRNFFDREVKLINMIEAYFWTIHACPQNPGLARPDLQKIINLFQSLPNKLYKNPYMLILGYILVQTIKQSGTKVVRDLINETRHEADISLSDVIRYYRLLESNPLLRS